MSYCASRGFVVVKSMTKVYEVPRYKNQTKRKIDLLLGLSTYGGMVEAQDAMKLAHNMAINGIDYYDLDIAETEDNYINDNIKYAYRDSRNMSNIDTIKHDIGDIIKSIVSINGYDQLLCDDYSMYHLVHAFLTRKIFCKPDRQERQTWNCASKMAYDLTITNLVTAKVGASGVNNLINKMVQVTDMSMYTKSFLSLASFCTKLHESAPSFNVHEAHDRLRSGARGIKYTEFENLKKYLTKLNVATKLYHVFGLKFLVFKDVTYCFDSSSTDQIMQCMRFWAGTFLHGENYDLTGGVTRFDFLSAVDKVIKWMGDIPVNFWYQIPRLMKGCLTIYLNDYASELEKFDTGSSTRSTLLYADLFAEIKNIPDVLPIIKSLTTRCDVGMDLLYLFHGLPCPDCDSEAMFNSFTAKLRNSNCVEENTWKDFMKYCKTFDLVELITRYKTKVREYIVTEQDYDIATQEFYVKCLQGTRTYPPDSDFGKAWVEGFYRFEKNMDTWFFEAADVTHVLPYDHLYTSIEEHDGLQKCDHNELLYALKYAPLLGKKYDPSEVRDQVIERRVEWDSTTVVAAKAENTKFGAKCRETYSGSDCIREVTSEYDRTGIKVARLGKASALRADPVSFDKRLYNITNLTRQSRSYRTIVISLDVSGWSPNGNRTYMLDHHAYVSKITDINPSYRLNEIWDNINLVINRRGIFKQDRARTGMFQGWTGTLDTALHQHICYYAIREGKRRGSLRLDENAHALCLIDDGVIALNISASRTEEAIREVVVSFCTTICDVYKRLGFVIDMNKTICSGFKYTFLNRFFCSGVEVYAPNKVLSKIDCDHTRKFASTRDQLNTIMGSGFSAVMKGADPIWTYYYSLFMCFNTIIPSHKIIMNLSCDEVWAFSHAPASIGGLGVPTIIDWLSPEIKDKLNHYLSASVYLAKNCLDEHKGDILLNKVMKLITATVECTDAPIVYTAPRNIYTINRSTAEGASNSKVKQAVLKFATSQIFKDALELTMRDDYLNAIKMLLGTITIDCSVLEELMSCTPCAAIAALYDRAVKNELLNILLSPHDKHTTTQLIRCKDRDNIRNVCTFLMEQGTILPKNVLIPISAYDTVFKCRATYLDHMGISIVNHTLPDPFYILGRIPDGRQYTICVNHKPISAGMIGLSNMKHGTTQDAPPHGSRSPGIITENSQELRGLDVITRIIIKGAAICAFVETKGGSGSSAWAIFKALWGATCITEQPRFCYSITPEASVKRIGHSITSKNHTCPIFRNTSGSVQVDASSLGRALEAASFHIDYMSVINTLRITRLLEMSVNTARVVDLYYGIIPGSADKSSPLCLEIEDTDSFNTAIAILSKCIPEVCCIWFKGAIFKYSTGTNDNEVEPGTTLEFVHHREIIGEIGSFAAHLRDIQSSKCEHVIELIRLAPHKRRKVVIDVAPESTDRSVNNMFRRLTAKHGDVAALLSCIASIAVSYGAKIVPPCVYKSSWNNCESCYDEVYGNLHANQILRTIPNMVRSIPMHVMSEFWQGMTADFRRAICGYDSVHDNIKKRAAVAAYMIGHGRLPRSDLYTSMAGYDERYALRAWDFAINRNTLLEIDARLSRKKSDQSFYHYCKHLYMGAKSAVVMSHNVEDRVKSLFSSLVNAINTTIERRDTSVRAYALSITVPSHIQSAEGIARYIRNQYSSSFHVNIPGRIDHVMGNLITDLTNIEFAFTTGVEQRTIEIPVRSTAAAIQLTNLEELLADDTVCPVEIPGTRMASDYECRLYTIWLSAGPEAALNASPSEVRATRPTKIDEEFYEEFVETVVSFMPHDAGDVA